MQRTICLLLIGLLLLPSSGCGLRARVEGADEAAGPAEIPLEILGELDQDTLSELVEEPKYVALTFDDGPTTPIPMSGWSPRRGNRWWRRSTRQR